MILIHSFNQILNYLEDLSYTWCVSAGSNKTSAELEFYNIFEHLIKFCTSENMNPFAEKTQFQTEKPEFTS